MEERQELSLKCTHCDTSFSTNSNLLRHQRTSKKCIKLRNEEVPEGQLRHRKKQQPCPGCKRIFSRKYRLTTHLLNCPEYKEQQRDKLRDLEIKELRLSYEEKFRNLEREHDEQMTKTVNEYEEKLRNVESDNRDKLDEMNYRSEIKLISAQLDATKAVNDKLVGLEVAKGRVLSLEKKYLRRKKRDVFPGEFVVYVLTTEFLRPRRTFILGSAASLVKRLSTYNKTCEHEVVFYLPCGDQSTMLLLERLVLKKFSSWREQANRDRFVLPEGKAVEVFKEALEDGLKFVKE